MREESDIEWVPGNRIAIVCFRRLVLDG